jgi:hypothetical protein
MSPDDKLERPHRQWNREELRAHDPRSESEAEWPAAPEEVDEDEVDPDSSPRGADIPTGGGGS